MERFLGSVRRTAGGQPSLSAAERAERLRGDPTYAFAAVVNESGVARIGTCPSRKLAASFAATTPTYLDEFADPHAPSLWAVLRSAPDWPAYETTTDAVMHLQPGAGRARDDFAERYNCEFWSALTP